MEDACAATQGLPRNCVHHAPVSQWLREFEGVAERSQTGILKFPVLLLNGHPKFVLYFLDAVSIILVTSIVKHRHLCVLGFARAYRCRNRNPFSRELSNYFRPNRAEGNPDKSDSPQEYRNQRLGSLRSFSIFVIGSIGNVVGLGRWPNRMGIGQGLERL